MKITTITTKEFEYDDKKELKRLKKCFKGDVLKRQLEIFDAFKAQEWDKVKDLYHDLPYNDDEECAEQEFVGSWIDIICGGWSENSYLTKTWKEISFN
jgi:hypothetical protein